ncbi:hypothetical protein DFH06DRAFT_748318 [Mycena polygramma]|nr:hypothetical protein DFH06DRAFT_748318 [Mycena polygramma]
MKSLMPRAVQDRICPCCKGPASIGICTGMAGAYSPTNALALALSRQEVSPEDGAATLAAHLGLTENGFTIIDSEKCAGATDELRELWSALMPDEFEDYGHPIVCIFCAKYLPSLVAAYKAEPDPYGPYQTMLVGVSQSLYFAKFLRSPLGSDLYVFYVDQLLAPHNCSCHRTEHAFASIVGLLILSAYAHEYKSQMQPLSAEVTERLTEWLSTAARDALEILWPADARPGDRIMRFEGHSEDNYLRMFNNCLTILNILRGRLKSEALQLSLTRGETFNRYAAQHDTKMTTRLECARCQTVAYCCRGLFYPSSICSLSFFYADVTCHKFTRRRIGVCTSRDVSKHLIRAGRKSPPDLSSFSLSLSYWILILLNLPSNSLSVHGIMNFVEHGLEGHSWSFV